MVNEMIRHLQRAENMYLETPTYNIVLQSLLEANEVSFTLLPTYTYNVYTKLIVVILENDMHRLTW